LPQWMGSRECHFNKTVNFLNVLDYWQDSSLLESRVLQPPRNKAIGEKLRVRGEEIRRA